MKELYVGEVVILVDDEDYPLLSRHKWRVQQGGRDLMYAVTDLGGAVKQLQMHRLIMAPPRGREIDHVNSNGLDNRKDNLRIATRSENSGNKRPYGRCKYKGVSWKERDKKWYAYIAAPNSGGRNKHLGIFLTPEEAALAYDTAAEALYGGHAWLNRNHFPELRNVAA